MLIVNLIQESVYKIVILAKLALDSDRVVYSLLISGSLPDSFDGNNVTYSKICFYL
ncbi:hypothetical protein SAMN05428977_101528 [Nitrosomonas sp. Nm166]|nr:hypothetical protein SAMN05428977_101528 [Nitrosomonas sp. Nm166]